MTPAVWEVQALLDQAEEELERKRLRVEQLRRERNDFYEEADRYRDALKRLASEATTNPQQIKADWVALYVSSALRAKPTNAELGQQLTAVMGLARAFGYRGAAEWIARVYGGMDDPSAVSQDIRSRQP